MESGTHRAVNRMKIKAVAEIGIGGALLMDVSR